MVFWVQPEMGKGKGLPKHLVTPLGLHLDIHWLEYE